MVANLIEFVSNHYLLSLIFVVLLVLLMLHEGTKGGKNISTRELTALVNSGEGVVIDIRPKKDFATGHIVDAHSQPYDTLMKQMTSLERFKDKTLIVVDAMGQHSGTACRELVKAGFKTVRLSGGIATWRGDNLPVVK